MSAIIEKLKDIEQLLLEKKSVLTLVELAAYTGFSTSFLYKLTAQKRIPHSKPFGKLILFDKKLVDEFLLSNPISPVEDIEQMAINYVTKNTWNGGRHV